MATRWWSRYVANFCIYLSDSLRYLIAEYLVASTQSLVALPEPLTFLDGALIACGFGTAYAACSRGNVSGRDHVLVTGLGPVGLGVCLIAKAMGARVLGIEWDKTRNESAKALGIEAIECSKSKEEDRDVSAAIAWSNSNSGQSTEPMGVDVAIDCSGSALARVTCLKSAKVWGRVVFVGEGGRVEFDVSDVVIHKSLSIFGSWVCSIGQMEELVKRLVGWNLHPEVNALHLSKQLAILIALEKR